MKISIVVTLVDLKTKEKKVIEFQPKKHSKFFESMPETHFYKDNRTYIVFRIKNMNHSTEKKTKTTPVQTNTRKTIEIERKVRLHENLEGMKVVSMKYNTFWTRYKS